jgi:lipid-binding SYLF domain-containing protein
MYRWGYLLCTVVALSLPARADDAIDKRLKASGEVLQEILDMPDSIPKSLLDKADCVVVLPSVKKAAFIFGGSYGRGVMTCRRGPNYRGPWSAPTMMVLEGGSFGLQIGGQATDFVLLVVNPKGADSLLGSKVKLGADASVAAGPVGRAAEASTDAAMRAEILSYSRSRGLFAGVSLAGATLHADREANQKIYGRHLEPKEIVHGNVKPPAAAALLLSVLTKHSPHPD